MSTLRTTEEQALLSVVFSGPVEALALDKAFSFQKTTGLRINTLVAIDHPDRSQAAGR